MCQQNLVQCSHLQDITFECSYDFNIYFFNYIFPSSFLPIPIIVQYLNQSTKAEIARI